MDACVSVDSGPRIFKIHSTEHMEPGGKLSKRRCGCSSPLSRRGAGEQAGFAEKGAEIRGLFEMVGEKVGVLW